MVARFKRTPTEPTGSRKNDRLVPLRRELQSREDFQTIERQPHFESLCWERFQIIYRTPAASSVSLLRSAFNITFINESLTDKSFPSWTRKQKNASKW